MQTAIFWRAMGPLRQSSRRGSATTTATQAQEEDDESRNWLRCTDLSGLSEAGTPNFRDHHARQRTEAHPQLSQWTVNNMARLDTIRSLANDLENDEGGGEDEDLEDTFEDRTGKGGAEHKDEEESDVEHGADREI